MPKYRLNVGVTLLIVSLILISAGVPSIWLGTNGIVINNTVIHYGATPQAEILYGSIALVIAAALIIVLVILFFAKRSVLDAKAPHFP